MRSQDAHEAQQISDGEIDGEELAPEDLAESGQVDEDWLWAMRQQEMEWTGENVDCPGLGQV